MDNEKDIKNEYTDDTIVIEAEDVANDEGSSVNDEGSSVNDEAASKDLVISPAEPVNSPGSSASAYNMSEKVKGTVEFENTAEMKTDDTSPKQPKKNKFKELFGDKPVTRKFLAAALGITLLLNAGISAGLMTIFNHTSRNSMPEAGRNGRPGSEQSFGDQNSGNFMTPPGNGNGQIPDQDNSQNQQSQSGASIGIIIRDDNGVYIAQVTGDNAKTAGFQEGDKIVSIDGTEVSTSDDLINAVQKHSAGDTISVTVERDGQQTEIKTVLE